MRTAFIRTLIEHARIDPRIFLVVGDLGYSVVEPFASEFPDRFLNAGVAEQNMTGMAAGLAAEGYRVFTYSIANFPTLRCLEQIRNDICHHDLSVTIVAVGAGLAYGNLGHSHHGVQDIAAMRCLPRIRIASPADPLETSGCVRTILEAPGPAYLRLGKAGERQLHSHTVIDGRPICVIRGTDSLAICATGSILSVALEAQQDLLGLGISATVFSLPFLSPLTTEMLADVWRCHNIITLEEHVHAGGMGSLVRELMPDGVRVRTFAVDRDRDSLVGSQTFLRNALGLTASAVTNTAVSLVR